MRARGCHITSRSAMAHPAHGRGATQAYAHPTRGNGNGDGLGGGRGHSATQPSASLLGALEDAGVQRGKRHNPVKVCIYLNEEGYLTPGGALWTPATLTRWLQAWRMEGLL